MEGGEFVISNERRIDASIYASYFSIRIYRNVDECCDKLSKLGAEC